MPTSSSKIEPCLVLFVCFTFGEFFDLLAKFSLIFPLKIELFFLLHRFLGQNWVSDADSSFIIKIVQR